MIVSHPFPPPTPPIFSPTIDAKTYQLPRYWWLWPWSTVALLGGRLETLGLQYDRDMEKVIRKLDAADRARLISFSRSDKAHRKIENMLMALRWIALHRKRTKNKSIGRAMVERAEGAIKLHEQG